MAKFIVNNFDIYKVEDRMYKAYLIELINSNLDTEGSLQKFGTLVGKVDSYAHDKEDNTKAKVKTRLAQILLNEALKPKPAKVVLSSRALPNTKTAYDLAIEERQRRVKDTQAVAGKTEPDGQSDEEKVY